MDETIQIELYEPQEDESLTVRTYKISNKVKRILINSEKVIWGFGEDNKMYDAELIDVDTEAIIMA